MLKLEDIGMGALAELFEEELAKVVQNIHDLRTKPDAVREINIKLKLKPDKNNRGLAQLETIVNSKLAPVPHTTQVLSGVTGSGVDISEADLSLKDTSVSQLQEVK